MKAGIALGSNLESRIDHLRSACRMIKEDLATPGKPVSISPVYETPPVDCPNNSPAFLNAVIEISTFLSPHVLLNRLQSIETQLGRPKQHLKNSPRTIDLDLLYCDTLTLSEPDLTLPHPRMLSRRFVLQPLSDINPDLILENAGMRVRDLVNTLPAEETFSRYIDSI
ncbi:MAG: 2-amino-4-hydroxy-6-hydroxymethyldihydropteridine diphosphokinase [Chthoniobacterales bacterium]